MHDRYWYATVLWLALADQSEPVTEPSYLQVLGPLGDACAGVHGAQSQPTICDTRVTRTLPIRLFARTNYVSMYLAWLNVACSTVPQSQPAVCDTRITRTLPIGLFARTNSGSMYLARLNVLLVHEYVSQATPLAQTAQRRGKGGAC